MPKPLGFKEFMSQGEHLREIDGDNSAAMESFELAYHLAETPVQKGQAQAQIGLTHWHAQNYEEATQTFLDLLSFGEENDEPNCIALAHRNLSRSDLSWEPTDQLSHARMAYEYAVKARRSDRVWFAHGAFNSCLSNSFNWIKYQGLICNRNKMFVC